VKNTVNRCCQCGNTNPFAFVTDTDGVVHCGPCMHTLAVLDRVADDPRRESPLPPGAKPPACSYDVELVERELPFGLNPA